MALAGAKQTARILEGGGGRAEPGRVRPSQRSVTAKACEMPCHPSEPSLSINHGRAVTLTPPSGTHSRQLVRRWSVKSAPTFCIHIPIETDLHGVDSGLLSSTLPSTGPPLPGGVQPGPPQVWPAASTLVTPSCFDISPVRPSSREQPVTHTHLQHATSISHPLL